MYDFTKKKFLAQPVERQHKKCAELLQLIYNKIAGLENFTSDWQLYLDLLAWMEVPSCTATPSNKIVADLYHSHLRKGGISKKEHHLLPPIRKGDRPHGEEHWPIAIYLDGLRSAHNVGSIIRTTEALALGSLYFSPSTPNASHKQVKNTAMGASHWVNCRQGVELSSLPYPIIALETSEQAHSLYEFIFPSSFTLVMGNEEYGCSDEALALADFLVEIPAQKLPQRCQCICNRSRRNQPAKKTDNQRNEMTKKSKKPQSSKVSPAITHFPTPMVKGKEPISDEKKIEFIADRFKEIMEVLGLDLTNDSLVKTPARVAKMFVKEVFSGLNEKNFPNILFFEENFHSTNEASLIMTKVGFTSFCEHHFVPMSGFAYVAYLPKQKIIGISKLPRLVRYFANRPQLQERLTAQIADSLAILLESEDVAVSVTANHQCVMARGIQDESNHTTTFVLRGQFQTNEGIRQEFFEGLRN